MKIFLALVLLSSFTVLADDNRRSAMPPTNGIIGTNGNGIGMITAHGIITVSSVKTVGIITINGATQYFEAEEIASKELMRQFAGGIVTTNGIITTEGKLMTSRLKSTIERKGEEAVSFMRNGTFYEEEKTFTTEGESGWKTEGDWSWSDITEIVYPSGSIGTPGTTGIIFTHGIVTKRSIETKGIIIANSITKYVGTKERLTDGNLSPNSIITTNGIITTRRNQAIFQNADSTLLTMGKRKMKLTSFKTTGFFKTTGKMGVKGFIRTKSPKSKAPKWKSKGTWYWVTKEANPQEDITSDYYDEEEC